MFTTPTGLAAVILGLALTAPLAAATPTSAKKTPAAMPAGRIVPAADGSVTRAQMIAEVKQVFNRADTNHDGYISRAEFAARMGVVLNRSAPAGATREQAQRMLDAANNAFNAVDTNHDGKLSFQEAEARPLAAFDAMDANHDGVLTLAEKQAAHDAQAAAASGPVGPQQPGPDAPGR